ncbi:MAG TPA: DUF4230 domain-containing protein [Clostridiaceae bacterium]|nr:DUF4230 domain-containing protein [Clostridiaceae bacterium]
MENKEEKIVTKENGKKAKIKSILTAIKKCPKIIKRGIIVLILIVVLALGINYSYVFNKEAETLSIEFKNVGQLVTQSAFIRLLEDSTVNRTIFEKFEIPFTESRKMFSYIVQVDAAINFEEISIEDINESTKTIKVKLPHAKVYNATPDLESFKSYIDSESWFSRIDSEKYNEALKDLTNQGKQDAIDNGILEKADENGKNIIESFIKSNKKYKEYNVEYEYIGGNKDE